MTGSGTTALLTELRVQHHLDHRTTAPIHAEQVSTTRDGAQLADCWKRLHHPTEHGIR